LAKYLVHPCPGVPHQPFKDRDRIINFEVNVFISVHMERIEGNGGIGINRVHKNNIIDPVFRNIWEDFFC
jgi:hypothetical protein